MKICLIIRHMIIAFCAVGTLMPMSAPAANSCRQILNREPSQNEIDGVLEDFAKMKVILDLAQVSGLRDIQFRLLNKQYEIKKKELLHKFQITEPELQKIIKKKISALQNEKAEKDLREKSKRDETAEVLRPLYTKVKTWDLQAHISSGKAVLSPDGKNIISFYDHTLSMLVLESGTETSMPMESAYILKDKALIYNSGKWQSLDLNSLEVQALALDFTPSKKMNSAVSENKETVLFYNGNIHEDGPAFYLFNQKGELVTSNAFPTEIMDTNNYVTVIDGQHWLINSISPLGQGRSRVYHYSPQSKKYTLLIEDEGTRRCSVNLIPGSNQVILNTTGLTISVVNLDTLQSLSRTFERITTVSHANSEFLLAHEIQKNRHNILKIEISDFSNSKAEQVLSGMKENEEILPVPGSTFLSLATRYRKFTPTSKLVDPAKFETTVFDFEDRYSAQSGRSIIEQFITHDGKRIVNYFDDAPSDTRQLDIWERK